MKSTQTERQTCQNVPSANDRPGFPLGLPARGAKENMGGIDGGTVDEVTLKLSGLIGVFELIVDLLSGNGSSDIQKNTMLDFAFFISKELQELFKTVSGVGYRD